MCVKVCRPVLLNEDRLGWVTVGHGALVSARVTPAPATNTGLSVASCHAQNITTPTSTRCMCALRLQLNRIA